MPMLKFSELLALKKQLPLTRGVRILAAHSCGLVALEKPIAVRSHPNPDEQAPVAPSLLQADYDFEGEVFVWQDASGQERRFCLVNRLDAPTSGVLLGTLTKELANILRDEFAQHRVFKTYYAIVKGKPNKQETEWVDKLTRKLSEGKLWVERGEDFEAKTCMQWVSTNAGNPNTSLLKLMPITGKTHQLRVQCALRGCPIVGDRRYGDFDFNRTIIKAWNQKRLFLHAHEIELSITYNNEVIVFKATSQLPEAFTSVYPNPQIKT